MARHGWSRRGLSAIAVGSLAALLLSTAPAAAVVSTVTQYVMSPSPIATEATLAANATVNVTVSAEDGSNALVPGATIYLSISQTTGGGSASVGATALTSTPAAFVATTGQITVTYQAPAVLPTGGRDVLKAANAATGATVTAQDSYAFTAVSRLDFSPFPIATPATLAANQSVAITLLAANDAGAAVPGATVYLSFSQATGGGRATVGVTALTSTPAAFTADGNGLISITYTAPAVLPAAGADRISAADATKNPTISRSDEYDFGGARFFPIPPARVLDTRQGLGLSGWFVTHHARTFVVAGNGGVAANAVAVTGNVTVTQQTAFGLVYVGPVPVNNPTSSTLNFPVGEDRADNVTVALGPGGTLSATYASPVGGATAQLIFDVTGYFQPGPSGSSYHAIAPARLLDTRNGNGLSGPFSSDVARTFQVTGRGGVPANATGVTGNLTVTQQTSGGFLYIGPAATNNPTSSTLNFPVNDDRANGVAVQLGGMGTLSVTYVAPALGPTAHVVFDVTGYFTADGTGALYIALPPTRLLDSRNGNGLTGAFTSDVARTFQVGGRGGVPGDASGVTGTLTVTQQSSGGFLFLGPVGVNNPTSSTLNFPVKDDRANGVAVELGAGGTLGLTYVAPSTTATTQAVFDVSGFFR